MVALESASAWGSVSEQASVWAMAAVCHLRSVAWDSATANSGCRDPGQFRFPCCRPLIQSTRLILSSLHRGSCRLEEVLRCDRAIHPRVCRRSSRCFAERRIRLWTQRIWPALVRAGVSGQAVSRDGQADRRRPRHDRGTPVPSQPVDPADDRQLRDPGSEADDTPEPANRNVQKRAHHDRVELRTRTAHQFLTRRGDADRLAVRAHRGHDLVRVGDSDDPPGEGDLIAGKSAGIPTTVVSLVMLRDRQRPGTEPCAERADQPGSLVGMAAHVVHLGGGELCRLGENLRRNDELADVMEERCPAKARAVGGSELHLAGDEVCEDPNPFGVPSRLTVVNAQRRHEFEHGLHVRHLTARHALVVRLLQLALQVTWLADPTSNRKPLGRFVGKEQ